MARTSEGLMKGNKIRAFDSKIELHGTEAEVIQQPGGFAILRTGAHQRRIYLGRSGDDVFFSVAGRAGFGKVERRQTSATANDEELEQLVSRFPGKVVKLVAEPGALVTKGSVLLVMEAMKMEFSIKAPLDGVVTQFLVAPAQQVSPGQKLVDFEASQKSSGKKDEK
jgi:biotin carboxyl carrier protein